MLNKLKNYLGAVRYAAYGFIMPVYAQSGGGGGGGTDLTVNLGWSIPGLGDILTFLIRFFFVMAGLLALFYLLLGALAWVTSGGEKGNVEKARDKITAAIVGVVLIVVVLSIIWTLERIVFRCRICMGISCPVTIPSIIDPGTPPPAC